MLGYWTAQTVCTLHLDKPANQARDVEVGAQRKPQSWVVGLGFGQGLKPGWGRERKRPREKQGEREGGTVKRTERRIWGRREVWIEGRKDSKWKGRKKGWKEGREDEREGRKENYEGGSDRLKDECTEGRMEGSWEGGREPTIRAGAQASPLELLSGATDPRRVQEEPRIRPSKSRPRSDSCISASVRLFQREGDQSRREGGAPSPSHHHGLRKQGLWDQRPERRGASAPARLFLASPHWGRGLVERQALASDPLWRAAAVSLSRCFQRFEMQPLFLKSSFLLLCPGSYCAFHLQPFPSLFSL